MTYLHNSLFITLLLFALANGQCTENTARCTGSNTYQVCTGGVYGANQTCQTGLVCSSNGSNAFCVRSSEVTTGVPASPPTPCSPENRARCTGTNTYQVCTGGFYGINQTCQSGLVCSSSSDNAFCVRPSEATTGVPASSTTGAAATTGAPASSTTGASCTDNHARCTGSNTYQVCTGGVFGANQTCQTGLVCSSSTDNAFCVRPSEVTTGVPASPMTTGAAVATTGTAGTACTENTARCTGSNTYQVCTGGVYGANQTCQTGLVCSSTGSNAFCVRPSEVTTGVPAAGSTTGAAASMTTGAASSGSSSGSLPGTACSSNGSQKCLSNNTYTTCTNGFYSDSQNCPSGLSCSPSGNNIYCIRIVSPGQPCSNNGDQSCLTSETYSTCTNNVGSNAQSCTVGTTCHPSGNNIYCY